MTYRLEQLLPDYDQREYHEKHLPCTPEIAWSALHDLRIRDLPLTVLLTRLRSGPKAWFGSFDGMDGRALDSVAPRELCADRPNELILGDIADYTGTRPERPEIARGDLGAFLAFDDPGWTKVVMNFRFTPDERGTVLSTETRVLATDEEARRAFKKYWLLVRAGSGVIRRDILSAIRHTTKNATTEATDSKDGEQ